MYELKYVIKINDNDVINIISFFVLFFMYNIIIKFGSLVVPLESRKFVPSGLRSQIIDNILRCCVYRRIITSNDISVTIFLISRSTSPDRGGMWNRRETTE